MSNKKMILGIAAGVAALAVVGVICKRKGYFDGFADKAEEFGGEIADKYKSVKETARKKIDEVVQKGSEIADKAVQKGSEFADKIKSTEATAPTNATNNSTNPATA